MAEILVTYPVLRELSEAIRTAEFGEYLIGRQTAQGKYDMSIATTTGDAFERGLKRNWGTGVGDVFILEWVVGERRPNMRSVIAMTLDRYLNSGDRLATLVRREFPTDNPYLPVPSVEFRAELTGLLGSDGTSRLVLRHVRPATLGQSTWSIVKERVNG